MIDDEPEAASPTNAVFPTTHWSRVLLAGGDDAEARASLAVLCANYWPPLYAFARRKGCSSEDACDVVQGLFAELLARESLRDLDPNLGRLRSFLMAACSLYLAKDRARGRALKRGGGIPPISIDAAIAEARFGVEPSHLDTAERIFDRRWASTLLDRALARVESENLGSGRRDLFEKLRPSVLGQTDSRLHREVADELGMTEGAVRIAAHRLRRRYREILRDEVARTVADPAEVDLELASLLEALSG
jgi:DNA-directed RNA polymerase specialized sigma24 family protein